MLFYLRDLEQSYDEPVTTPMHRKKNKTLLNAFKPPLSQPSLTVPIIKTADTYRPRNFRVRVYRNGGDGPCAYCASCSMNLLLTEATRKLQLIRPAKRLFDAQGHEILRIEDIQRDMEYYVSEGEDFISPWQIINSKIQYGLHSTWKIDGLTSSYTIKRPRRIRRRKNVRCIQSPELKDQVEDLPMQYEDKDTQTMILFENKDIQTDGKIPSITKNTQTVMNLQNKSIQANGKLTLQNKDTQTITNSENRDVQTDGMMSRETRDTQTIITQWENKTMQTDDNKIPVESKNTQTITKYEQKEVQVDIPSKEDPTTPPASDNSQVIPTDTMPTSSSSMNTSETLPAIPDSTSESPLTRPIGVEKSTQTNPSEIQNGARRPSSVGVSSTARNVLKTDRQSSRREEADHRLVSSASSDVIYLRPTSSTNFRVRVYRNGERYRYAYCKSCSMDIILSAATQKLQMPIPARRLFDENGVEIFHSRDIQRHQEYYVSSGGNFKNPFK